MSHKVGQIEEHNQQLNSDSLDTLEENSASSHNALTDRDYEFLFNQLLEGVAHGWHQHRIVKFFKQLGERGQQHLWVSWLERFGIKLANISSPFGQQLGALMMRLGELTQSNGEVKEIGTLSYRLGEKLLIGDRQDLIWEYDGPDWQPIPESISEFIANDSDHIQDNDNLSERLPQEFTDLAAVSAAQIADNSSALTDKIDEISLAEIPDESEDVEPASLSPVHSDAIETPLELELTWEATEIEPLETVNKSENSKPESLTPDHDDEIETPAEVEFSLELTAIDAPEILPESKDLSTTETPIPSDSKIGSVNWQKFISLIEQDEELVKEITQKLDHSEIDSHTLAQETLAKLEQTEKSDTPDKSSLELVQSWFNLGLKQVTAGEFESAVASWEKALKLNPNLSEAWHNRGSALGRLGRYEEAIESFDKALEIAIDNYQAWNDRAHALYQLQKWEAAVVSWSKAIEFMPGNHLFWYNRGCALEQLECSSEAIASYEKALEIKPDFQLARSRYIDLIADNSRTN